MYNLTATKICIACMIFKVKYKWWYQNDYSLTCEPNKTPILNETSHTIQDKGIYKDIKRPTLIQMWTRYHWLIISSSS